MKKRSNNEGSIIALPNGRFRVFITAGISEDGCKQRMTKIFETKAEAKEFRDQVIAEAKIYGKKAIAKSSESFTDKFLTWLLKVKKNEVQSQTFANYMRHYKNHILPFFKTVKLQDLKSDDFEKFFLNLNGKKIGMENQRKIRGLLYHYFEYEYRDSPLRNPLEMIKIVKDVAKAPPTPEAVFFKNKYKGIPKELREKFWNALDTDKKSDFLKPLCYTMYFTGNRVGETLPYQWRDFDFTNRYILVYKGITREYTFDEEGNKVGKSKTVIKGPKTEEGIRPLPLVDALYEILIQWYEHQKAKEKFLGVSLTAPSDYVFAKDDGSYRSEQGTSAIFNRFLKRNGLHKKGIHFHALRQSFSNILFASKTDEAAITDLMGHTDIKTTKKNYNSLEKFESVKKAADLINNLVKPQNPKYCAPKGTSYAPADFIPELEAAPPKSPITPTPQENSLEELISELAANPMFLKFIELAKAQASKDNEME